MTLDKFIYHYLLKHDFTLTEAGKKEAMEKFFSPPTENGKESLEIIDEIWEGAMNNVWVTSLNNLKNKINTFPKNAIVDYVCYSLALDCSEGTDIVYIMYPVNYKNVEFRKPTVLDVHFQLCKFYLSIKSDDGWGKTFSANIKTDGFLERVHKSFQGLSKEFEGKCIGKTATKIECKKNDLLREAKKRASQC